MPWGKAIRFVSAEKFRIIIGRVCPSFSSIRVILLFEKHIQSNDRMFASETNHVVGFSLRA